MNISIEVTLTPEQLAQEFWDMYADQQTEFFNRLAVIAEPWRWEEQMTAIAKDPCLNRQAKDLLHAMGACFQHSLEEIL